MSIIETPTTTIGRVSRASIVDGFGDFFFEAHDELGWDTDEREDAFVERVCQRIDEALPETAFVTSSYEVYGSHRRSRAGEYDKVDLAGIVESARSEEWAVEEELIVEEAQE